MGMPSRGLPLPLRRPPLSPACGANDPWPPPVGDLAMTLIERAGRRRGGRDRSASELARSPWHSLAYYCAVGLDRWPCAENILGAVHGLLQFASETYYTGGEARTGSVDYRSLALYNAALFLSVFPSRTISAFIEGQAEEAMGELEGVPREVWAELVKALRSTPKQPMEKLRWRGRRLVARTPAGERMLCGLPPKIRATWPGVQSVLAEHGLEAPRSAPWPAVEATVAGREIVVAEATVAM